MKLGKKLAELRKKSGVSQKIIAQKLGVSRQTISNWETGQTIPELVKVKSICQYYHVGYEYLIGENENRMNLTNIESVVDTIDWTSAWSQKYPILRSYQGINGVEGYQQEIGKLYDTFKREFGMEDQDTVLVLKDILYQKYKESKKKNGK